MLKNLLEAVLLLRTDAINMTYDKGTNKRMLGNAVFDIYLFVPELLTDAFAILLITPAINTLNDCIFGGGGKRIEFVEQ